MFVVFAVAAAALYGSAPVAGDFAWSDAPRHALNGIFVHDFLAHLPLSDPRGFAVRYYLQYPALTILFYPPLFSVALAGAYAAFGFSHAVAQGTVTVFYLLLGCLYYQMARRWLPPLLALAAGLLLVGAPEITVWGRQVMLDIPAYAWLVAMVTVFLRYLDAERPCDLYCSVLLLTIALYTKQTPLFVIPALVIGVWAGQGRRLLGQRHVWAAGLLGLVLIAPLILLQLKFGQVNSASMLGGSERADMSRLSLGAWTYYASVLPAQLGWPTVILAVVYLVGSALRPAWRLPRAHMVFLLAWLVCGYLFFSFIMVREPRHDLMVLLPLPLFAMLAVRHLVAGPSAAWAQTGAVLLGVGVLAWSITYRPIQFVRGYAQAAEYVLAHAPEHSVVLFSGNRDGSFIFNMRAGTRDDVSVARADKLLFRVSIERERGIQDRQLTGERILEFFRLHGVRYVVYDPDFWQDLPSMAALSSLLEDSRRFALVQEVHTTANFDQADKRLRIYQFLGELQSPALPLGAELVGIGAELKAN
ncbi:ArnT family glycosyltransferase [Rhodoferax sp.]|uniref:ArnT family glycosyltransferase n=1 Tax=Rhodoferax sp. TaxID=50421 RepID=UPI00374CA108